MKQATIQLRNLAIGYKGKNDTKVVASDICTAINGGELTCLLGANGVGKSTLLRTLSAFQPKLEERLILWGGDWHVFRQGVVPHDWRGTDGEMRCPEHDSPGTDRDGARSLHGFLGYVARGGSGDCRTINRSREDRKSGGSYGSHVK
ncbi:MAG: ATP-binding cassette domain-containing protein [Butyricimonas faecihominis]